MGGVFNTEDNSCKIDLSVEEHIDIAINTFKGVAESLQYLRPYLIKYSVIPFRLDIEGSTNRMTMKKFRDRDKFMRNLDAILYENMQDGIITQEEKDKTLRYASEATSIPDLPYELKNKGLPDYLIHLVEQEIRSDIDCTLHFRPVNNAAKLEMALYEDKTIYDNREIPVWVEVSEIASNYTNPFPINIKFGYDDEDISQGII